MRAKTTGEVAETVLADVQCVHIVVGLRIGGVVPGGRALVTEDDARDGLDLRGIDMCLHCPLIHAEVLVVFEDLLLLLVLVLLPSLVFEALHLLLNEGRVLLQ